MSEVPKGSSAGYSISTLDNKDQDLLNKVGEKFDIEILHTLGVGFSGAHLYLVNIQPKGDSESKLVVLKLDRYNKKKNEDELYSKVLKSFSDDFISSHFVKMAYPAIIVSRTQRIALFYEIAGHSLTDYRPLRMYNDRRIKKLVIKQIASDLLSEWNNHPKYDRYHLSSNIVQRLFSTRFSVKNNRIEAFLREVLAIDPTDGILVHDTPLPCAFNYLISDTPNQAGRDLFFPIGPQHGDLNQGNILALNPKTPNFEEISYYLIDFLHFTPNGSCLFDILSLELSIILDYADRTKLTDSLVPDIVKLGNSNISDLDFSTEFGLLEILDDLRRNIINFVLQNHPSHQDDWIAAFNLVGIAVGLIATNTQGLATSLRTLAYIYAASHLKYYQERFGIPLPSTINKITVPTDQQTQVKIFTHENPTYDQFFSACNSFSPDHAYVGVFGEISGLKPETLQVLARIPWNAIIDFDPNTEKPSNLLGSIKNSLNLKRFVHILLPNEKTPGAITERACYWFAARGLTGDGEISKLNLTWRYWYKNQSRSLENFIERIASSTLKPITVVIFWDDGTEGFVEDILKMMTRNFDDRVNFVLANQNTQGQETIINKFDADAFPLKLSQVIDGLYCKLLPIQEVDDIILPFYDGVDNNLGYISLPLDIFNWLEEDCEVIHFNLASIQKEDSTDDTSFLRGRRISWFELDLHFDIDRNLTRDLVQSLEKNLSSRERKKIKLIHEPGAGGTTIASRVAWELHWTYPVLVLHRFSNTTVDRIREVYTKTQQPVLVVIDTSFVPVTSSLTAALFDSILAKRVPAVFLIVARDFDLPFKSEQTFTLQQQLNNLEANRFSTLLSKEVPSKARALESLVNHSDVKQRTPFVFCLTAFEKEFIGIENFVKTRLQDLSEQERTILVIISLTSYFSNQNIPSQIFTFFVGLPPSQAIDLRKYLDKRRLDLLISDESGWRPLHVLVAEEILIQLLADQKEPEQWREMLTDYAKKIIEILSNVSSQAGEKNNQIISTILRSLFIDRQDADIDEYTLGSLETRFSNYIELIPSIEGKKLVFDKLVEEFDNEPHFWGHRSRFIYSYAVEIHDYEEAISSADTAIHLSSDDDPALYHIKGMALAKWSTYLMSRVLQELDTFSQEELAQRLLEIDKLVQNALAVFRQIRDELRLSEERAYVSAIELLTRYIEFGKLISPYETFAEFLKSSEGRRYSEYLQAAENLLRQVRRLRVGYARDSRFVQEREVFLGKVYDDYSLFINGLWELVSRDDVYRPRYRRSLAYAYLARSGRNWDSLDQRDLERIRDLMDENLLADPQDNSHNLRLWFEAARRLPSTGLDYAIQKLTQWVSIARKNDTLDAYYYLYALQSIAAIEGSEIASKQAVRSLEMSKKLAQDRPNRTNSLDWVGNQRGVARLLSRGSLGRFQEDTSFFGKSDIDRLEPIYGRIYRIQSGQSGIINAYGLKFFFTPSSRSTPFQFTRDKDNNLAVTFFASFSYDGPRAWNVEPA